MPDLLRAVSQPSHVVAGTLSGMQQQFKLKQVNMPAVHIGDFARIYCTFVETSTKGHGYSKD